MAGMVHGIGSRLGRKPGRTGGSRRMMSEINVTPFVDVMLVLLVVFMVTAPLMTAGVNVELPDANAPALPGQDEPLSVSLDKQGQVYVQNSKIKLDELGPKLKAITGEKKDARIFVYADQNVEYGDVMELVTAIADAGFLKVGFVTDAPHSKQN